jgi:hypothetical protein
VSKQKHYLHIATLVRNGGSVIDANGSPNDRLARDVGIQIFTPGSSSNEFWLAANGPLFPGHRTWTARLPLTAQQLFGHVQDCRRVWHDAVINCNVQLTKHRKGTSYPFGEHWDVADYPDCLVKAAPKLAVAGAQLFFSIFEAHGDPVLSRVAQHLRNASQRQPLVMTITSDVFFVPWALLYIHPSRRSPLHADGRNFEWEGFWGYRHIVEHNTEDLDFSTWFDSERRARLQASLNFDDRIDAQSGAPCIAPQRAFFRSLRDRHNVAYVERRSKVAFQRALMSRHFRDTIAYFYCHGTGGDSFDGSNMDQAHLTLSDGERITASNLRFWLNTRGLRSKPVVFINACQGGQMTTLFYKTVAAEFLRQQAAAVVGAQIDIPAIFAAEYARRFFQRLFRHRTHKRLRGRAHERKLGFIMRTLAREFVHKHHNPLGFAYSLYHGIDCCLP